MRGLPGRTLALLLLVPGSSVAAQRAPPALRCDGLVVSAIRITPREPTFVEIPAPLRGIARAAGVVHTTSKPETIAPFLLLEIGRACSERERAESERILRLQPFLADATVRAVPDGAGGVRIDVTTVDEVPTIIGLQFRDTHLSLLRLGNDNIAGRGLSVAGQVERGYAYRTGFGITGAAYQLLGRPYTLALAAERAPLGSTVALAFSHTFFTDLQRSAWHASYRDVNEYLAYARPDMDDLSLGVRRRFWDMGAVRRVGPSLHGAFAGGLITGETVEPASNAVVVSDSGLVPDFTGALGSPSAHRNLRFNAVVGARWLSFLPVSGFDALVAVQDLATGAQGGFLVGRGVPSLGADDDDVFLSGDLYAGLGSATSYTAIRLAGEGRKDRDARRWDSMVGSARLAWYVKPSSPHVLTGSLEFAGAWRSRVPFQVSLGDRLGGVRGYGASHVAGALRAVARVEERWSIGLVTRHAAVGVATFVDAGRVWAGSAPFGTNSTTKVGVGAGLLAAFPPESQRLWRLDVAIPASPDGRAHTEVRVGSVWTRAFWREPIDVVRGRAGVAPSTIFTWP